MGVETGSDAVYIYQVSWRLVQPFQSWWCGGIHRQHGDRVCHKCQFLWQTAAPDSQYMDVYLYYKTQNARICAARGKRRMREEELIVTTHGTIVPTHKSTKVCTTTTHNSTLRSTSDGAHTSSFGRPERLEFEVLCSIWFAFLTAFLCKHLMLISPLPSSVYTFELMQEACKHWPVYWFATRNNECSSSCIWLVPAIGIYLCMALQPFCRTLAAFQFLNPYTAGVNPWTGDQPVARPLHTHRINAHRQPYLEWDSKPWSKRSNEQRPRGHCDRQIRNVII
jgi:hypothetical protein